MKTHYNRASLLEGKWVSPDPTQGYKGFVTIRFDTNGILYYVFEQDGTLSELETNWQYENGVIVEERHGQVSRGSLQWMNDDYFILTILENGAPAYKGVQRHYRRIREKN